MLKFKLCDADLAEYGGQEWETFDSTKFENARAGELERYERDTGLSIEQLLAAANGELTAAGVRALVWIARCQRGLRMPFNDFDIHTLRLESKYEDDGLPQEALPLESSPESSGASG